jgi:hypothetical protein
VTASSSPSLVLSSWLVLSYWYDVVPATDSSAKAQGQGEVEVTAGQAAGTGEAASRCGDRNGAGGGPRPARSPTTRDWSGPERLTHRLRPSYFVYGLGGSVLLLVIDWYRS